MRIVCVVGARPNFMKMAPVYSALRSRGRDVLLVHTGQHYDPALSGTIIEELGLPEPDLNLGVGSGSHARQTANVMVEFEAVCEELAPDLVLVGGDVNSTVAVSLVASKLGVGLGHVEAGLRSFDRTMPEELNRIVTDQLSDLLFVTEASGVVNLRREGIADERVHLVGNTMIDSLRTSLDRSLEGRPWQRFGLDPGGYALVTLHRPSNVDDPAALRRMAGILEAVSQRLPVLFPVHPRAASRLAAAGLAPGGVTLVEPLPYLQFVGLMARAAVVLTDSGGIQEETTALGVPCLTLRENTERPSTVEAGTNLLVGSDLNLVAASVERILAEDWPAGSLPPLWDGRAGERVADVVVEWRSAGP